jgi:uncharacterized Zn ribbon protein
MTEDFGNWPKCDNCGNEWGPMFLDRHLFLCQECHDEYNKEGES